MRVLISDNLSELGVKIFRESDALEVDVKVGLSPEELKQIIGQLSRFGHSWSHQGHRGYHSCRR